MTGVARLMRAFASVEHRGWSLFSAVLDLILGVLILSWPDQSLVTLAVFFGISLIFRGVVSLVAAFQLRKLRKGGSADMAPPISAAPADRAHRLGPGARSTQRKPMWPVEVSTASPWRAAGR